MKKLKLKLRLELFKMKCQRKMLDMKINKLQREFNKPQTV